MSGQKQGVVAPEHDRSPTPTKRDNGHGSDNGSHDEGTTYAYSGDRKLGVLGTVFLILNRMVGTGVFSTPSSIFAATGSVGISLILWLVGGILAFFGLSVYLEFGLAIPRSGGEKNYLERVYRRPRYLATCVLAAQVMLLTFSAGNALSFGRYSLLASGRQSDGWEARGIAISVVVFAVVVHSVFPKCGIRLFNVLGVFKVISLLFVIFSGFAALAGRRRVPNYRNFDNAFSIQDGDGYQGWEGANYVLCELKDPRRTLAIAAPLTVGIVTILYLLVNVAYFAAISKSELAKSEVLVAGVFFRNMFGDAAGARILPVLVALSNLGNVLAGTFAIARVKQEIGKEGLLPFSRFWGSNKPFNTPAAALLWHGMLTIAVLAAAPVGPAYTFIVKMSTYPPTWIQAFVTAGLIWLQYNKWENWNSPWHTPLPISIAYLLSNVFLMIVPLMPPRGDWNAGGYPYYVLPVVGVGVLLLGAVYWALWAKVLPCLSGSKVVCERAFDEEGVEVVRYRTIAVTRQ
ncbi:hypothetical protein G6O67_002163 [Ophiocordyceps sinensis]|uniref:Amino acid/polyamine transporter I n=1 Tax=Ophiocordyceps sinensis TaxID=72228 RepID=A0A8H4V787_9HYPO|nr:hypothetical protein G6O67_002163 [Ophiocordyceps sinensis]